MKRISLLLLLSGILCCVSCAPEEDTADSAQKSESVVKTEVTPKETPVEPAPAVTEPEKIEIPKPQNPVVKMVTTKGEIDIELYADKAPITVANFLAYIKSGFYNDTIFHRVIPNFMIQGGGFTPKMVNKLTSPSIKNESYNKIRNKRGTLAMARTNAPDSATSQFFINHKDNKSLDFDGPYKPGYAVFGKVIKGMDVVDRIALLKTKNSQYFDKKNKRNVPCQNVPIETVLIESVTVIE